MVRHDDDAWGPTDAVTMQLRLMKRRSDENTGIENCPPRKAEIATTKNPNSLDWRVNEDTTTLSL